MSGAKGRIRVLYSLPLQIRLTRLGIRQLVDPLSTVGREPNGMKS